MDRIEPQGYRIQDGCWNCKHAVNEGGEELHCDFVTLPQTLDATNADDAFYEVGGFLLGQVMGTRPPVKREGICPEWKRREPELKEEDDV